MSSSDLRLHQFWERKETGFFSRTRGAHLQAKKKSTFSFEAFFRWWMLLRLISTNVCASPKYRSPTFVFGAFLTHRWWVMWTGRRTHMLIGLTLVDSRPPRCHPKAVRGRDLCGNSFRQKTNVFFCCFYSPSSLMGFVNRKTSPKLSSDLQF